MPTTQTTDVAVRMRRPLDTPETALAAALIDVAESRIRVRLGDDAVTDRLTDEPHFAKLLKGVVADAVARVVRNPEGYRQESVGPFSWTFDVSVASGQLEISDLEWETLDPVDGSAGGAFAVDTALPPPVLAGWPPVPFNPLISPGYWGDLS